MDGLIIVASVSLVELAARRREAEKTPSAPATTATASAAPASVQQPPEPGDAGPAHPRPALEGQSIDADTPRLDVVREPNQRPATDRSSGDTRLNHAPDSALHGDDLPDVGDDADEDVDLAADLVPLLPAARVARDELIREGLTVSRDALARRLRSNGHSIRNSAVSELLAALRQETRSVNGSRPTAQL